MDREETLALLSIDPPTHWLQYRDSTWAPVWENGRIGDSFTPAELHTLATTEHLPSAVTQIKDRRPQPYR